MEVHKKFEGKHSELTGKILGALFQEQSVGRVGGALPPYRDQNNLQVKVFLKIDGLDTPLDEHSGLLDHRKWIEI
jgi:hypothetical protein